MQLKATFIELLTKYNPDNHLITELWQEIEKKYSEKNRHYHTLQHLESLLIQLNEVKDKIHDWHTVLFTLFYHDAVYNALKSDNEEQSALLAEKRMKQLTIPAFEIDACKTQILATKKHLKSSNTDTNYFTDADLSILGKSWEIYSEYYKNVRKEYSLYPNMMYNPGRRKALKHFLDMERIFKTEEFYVKYEAQAKKNLQEELMLL